MDKQLVQSETVLGVFPDDPTARLALSRLAGMGIPRDAIGVLAVEADGRPKVGARQGLLTGAAMGSVGGALLEATLLSFPPATVFIAGGTLVAALAGLSVGAGAGAVAGALTEMGIPRPTARTVQSTLTGNAGRVLVSVSSPQPDLRARARMLMRVQGALETHDPDDDRSETHFAHPFVGVMPQLKQHLREREGDTRRHGARAALSIWLADGEPPGLQRAQLGRCRCRPQVRLGAQTRWCPVGRRRTIR